MTPRRSNVAELFPSSAEDDDENDPVWAAFQRAPFAKEPETDEQRRLAEAAKRGPFRAASVVSAEIKARCEHGN